jgi:glycosyltransferase involved in cell wall biosynthesis
MKIIHFAASLSRSAGGLYYSVSGLARSQMNLGEDVGVVGGADAFFEQDKSQWGEVPLTSYPISSGSYAFNPLVAYKILKMRPDILHVHGIWSASSVYGRICSLFNIPTVVSPRGMLDPWILSRKPNVKRIHSSLFERPLLKRSLVHALAVAEEEAINSFIPNHAANIMILPNGITNIGTQKNLQRNGAVFLGRLHEKKQTLELIERWGTSSIVKDLNLTVAGWGDELYTDLVRNACDLYPNVKFVGPVYGEKKAALFSNASFFILPSLSEGLPMAVLEAISLGCIPIITKECNLPELLDDGTAIELAHDFSNFTAVCGKLAVMSESDKVKWSDRAMARANDYSWDKIGHDMLEHYKALIRRNMDDTADV